MIFLKELIRCWADKCAWHKQFILNNSQDFIARRKSTFFLIIITAGLVLTF